jgi:hypothetical protein
MSAGVKHMAPNVLVLSAKKVSFDTVAEYGPYLNKGEKEK